MARIKFTGPSRPKDAASSYGSPSTTPAPAQKTNSEKANGSKKEKMETIQEQHDDEEMQFFKQWQSLDLVMIMVHVAVSLILSPSRDIHSSSSTNINTWSYSLVLSCIFGKNH